MCQLINITCEVVQEVDHLNAKPVIYRGIELNNIFLYEAVLMTTVNFGFITRGQWDLPGVILKMWNGLLCFLNDPIEDPNWKAIHWFVPVSLALCHMSLFYKSCLFHIDKVIFMLSQRHGPYQYQ